MRIRTSKEIGEQLKSFRKLRGLTQEQLAEMVEVSFQQIQKYENGNTRLNTDKLQIIADVLKVHVAAFFDEGCRDEKLLSDQEQKLIKGFRNIASDDVREFITTTLLK